MRAPAVSMSWVSKPGRKLSSGIALPSPSAQASPGSIEAGKIVNVCLAAEGVREALTSVAHARGGHRRSSVRVRVAKLEPDTGDDDDQRQNGASRPDREER